MASSRFTYEARDGQGRKISGSLMAKSRQDAYVQLRKAGLTPWRLDVQDRSQSAESEQVKRSDRFSGRFMEWLHRPIQLGRKLSPRQQSDTLWQLAGLIKAGLPVDQALGMMVHVQRRRELKDLLRDAHEKVRQGRPLSDALAARGEFPAFVVSMLRAGEASGELEHVLFSAAAVLRQNAEVRALIISSLAYPLFLLAVSTIAVITLLTVVVPRFLGLFSTWGGELPWATQVLVNAHAVLQAQGGLIAVALLLLVGVGFWWIRTSNSGRMAWGRLTLTVPLIGPAIRDAAAVRLVGTLAVMLRGGVPLPAGLQVASGVVGNAPMCAAVSRTARLVQDGASLAAVWRTERVLPLAVAELVAIGEATGDLPLVLDQATELLNEQTRQRIKVFSALLEPMLLLGMALVIGFIVMAILLPIISLTNFPF